MRSSESEAFKVKNILSEQALAHYARSDQDDIAIFKAEAKKILCKYLELRMYNPCYHFFVRSKDSFKIAINDMPTKFKCEDTELFEDKEFLHKANEAFANTQATHANDFLLLCKVINSNMNAKQAEKFSSVLDDIIKLHLKNDKQQNKSSNFADTAQKIKQLIDQYIERENISENKKIFKLITRLKFDIYDKNKELIPSLEQTIKKEIADLNMLICYLNNKAHERSQKARNQQPDYLPTGINLSWYVNVVDEYWTSTINQTRNEIEISKRSNQIFLDYCCSKNSASNTAFNYIYALLMLKIPDQEKRIKYLEKEFTCVLNEELIHKMFLLRQILPAPDDVRKYINHLHLQAVYATPRK